MPKAEKVRMNLYISPDVKNKVEVYADENFMTTSACVNMILRNYFEGRDILTHSEQMEKAFASLVSVYKDKVEG